MAMTGTTACTEQKEAGIEKLSEELIVKIGLLSNFVYECFGFPPDEDVSDSPAEPNALDRIKDNLDISTGRISDLHTYINRNVISKIK